MSILIDSTVWSIGLRRRKRNLNPTELKIFYEWERILEDGNAVVIGLIRQEVLSGIAVSVEFESVRQRLVPTPDLSLTTDTYVVAAEFYNVCRSAGIAPGSVDMTICAAAHTHGVPIFTTDPDFVHYAKVLPVTLHKW
jgi:predicted nucleic acid-binding protein